MPDSRASSETGRVDLGDNRGLPPPIMKPSSDQSLSLQSGSPAAIVDVTSEWERYDEERGGEVDLRESNFKLSGNAPAKALAAAIMVGIRSRLRVAAREELKL